MWHTTPHSRDSCNGYLLLSSSFFFFFFVDINRARALLFLQRHMEAQSSIFTGQRTRASQSSSRSKGLREMGGCYFSQRTKVPPICGCGVEAPLLTSWTGLNPGRKFYGCGLFKVGFLC